jgi:hypothetical protein
MANPTIRSIRFVKNCKLDHVSLRLYMRVGLRRGTWSALSRVEKALYRCGLWVAKARGRITSMKLSVSVIGIITKLVATIRSRIYALGLARARTLRRNYVLAGVFDWAPGVSAWFSRAEYIMYLGITELNG